MKKIFLPSITILILILIGIYCVHYYYPRKVSFELAKEIDKPYKEFSWIGYDYVENAERLDFYMVRYYNKPSCIKAGLKGYSLNFVENLAQELDFDKYDYIIAYQKKIKELRHSPYLTKTEDCLYFDKRTPLIPTWDSVLTDKVYIYRIEKNNEYRAPGP